MNEQVQLMGKEDIAHTLQRLAAQIVERHQHAKRDIMLVGIQRRGADLARRLERLLAGVHHMDVPLGTLDISLYRDDWTTIEGKPHIGQSNIPADISARVVILVDDVLFTGRTVRAALEALLDYGRPLAVELLVLIDRGHRELPIQADYIGKSVYTKRCEYVNVSLEERDGNDAVMVGSSL